MKTLFLALLLLLAAATVEAQTRTQFTHTQVNITTNSTPVVSGSHRLLIIQNDSDTDMYCNMAGGTAVANEGLRLVANGGSGFFDIVTPTTAISCIHGGSGDKVLLVTRGL